MTTDRRSFVKTACLAGLCACGANGQSYAQSTANSGAQSDAPKPPTMPQKWIATLLPQLAAGDREAAGRILKGCGSAHYEDLKMQATVDRFRGNVEEFLAYLRKEWGWAIQFDKERGIIQVDENKSYCVCPVVPKGNGADLGMICYCSEGFAEKLFSGVVGSHVRATVTESIRRGDKSCKYRIELGTG